MILQYVPIYVFLISFIIYQYKYKIWLDQKNRKVYVQMDCITIIS